MYASDRCRWKKTYRKKKIFRMDTNAPVSYTHQTCLLSSTAATAPLFHLFWTRNLAPCPFRPREREVRSADQYANSLSCLCALACGWPKFQAALDGVRRGGPSFCLFFNLRLHRRHDGEKGTLRFKRLTLYTTAASCSLCGS